MMKCSRCGKEALLWDLYDIRRVCRECFVEAIRERRENQKGGQSESDQGAMGKPVALCT